MNIIFAKKSQDVKIPCKETHNAGYDIYAYFQEEKLVIKPHETKMIPTGLYSAFSEDYYIQLVERGSTGSKGIAQRCGVIDSSYRGEWFVPITNTTDKELIISKEIKETTVTKDYIGYPYNKAICQAVLLPVPKVEIKEISIDDFLKLESDRGTGCLGSSGK